jgi:hypothetical protein
VTLSYPARPRRDQYETALGVALLDTPTPPRTIDYVPTNSPGATARPMANPDYSAWRQAQVTAFEDRAMIRLYETFLDEHANLYADCQHRVARGLATPQDETFVLHYERLRDEQPTAVQVAEGAVEVATVKLAAAGSYRG